MLSRQAVSPGEAALRGKVVPLTNASGSSALATFPVPNWCAVLFAGIQTSFQLSMKYACAGSVTSLAMSETKEVESPKVVQSSSWIGWLPISVLPLTAVTCRNLLPPWEFMWILSFTIYLSLKWLTWWRARSRLAHPAWRSVAYLLAWPGMDADDFLDAEQRVPPPALPTWLWATCETIVGAILLWVVARRMPQGQFLLSGWVGMIGLILLLHFGTFQIVALLWQSLGVKAEPIMSAPLRSTSLGEFWGKRWNLGFRELAHELIFRPLYRTLGAGHGWFLGLRGIWPDP